MHPEDKITWADGETCLRCELSAYSHRSDDYTVTPYRDPSDTLRKLQEQVKTGVFEHKADEEALKGAESEFIRLRILVERAIIRVIAKTYCSEATPVKYDDGGGPEEVRTHTDVETLMSEIGACDEETLQVSASGQYTAIRLIYGNCGYDVVADMSNRLLRHETWAAVEVEISHMEDVMNLL